MPDNNGRNNLPNMTPERRRRGITYMAILLVFLVYFLVQGRGMCSSERHKEIATSDFVTAVKEGRVTEVTYKASSSTLEGEYYETPAAKERGTLTPFTSAYVGEDKIVDVNIRRLRMKVEDEPSNPKHIITVWGLGYKWDSGE